jgi:hypothetical protein
MKAHMGTLKTKGDMAIVMSPRDNISIMAWLDSKVAVAISNCHPPAVVMMRRRMKGLMDEQELPCPLTFAEYNANMGAIDDFDRLLSFLTVRLRCMKWWHQIFYFIIDVSLVNSLHLWRIDNPEESQLLPRRTWVAGLIEEIIAKYGDRKGCDWVQGCVAELTEEEEEETGEERQAENTGGGRGGLHQGMAKANEVLKGTERLTGRHFVAKRQNRGNCALCYACRSDPKGQKQVVTFCEECRVMLHVPECFKEWHTKKVPRSPFV